MDGEYTYSPFHHTFLERKLFTMSKYVEFKRKGKFYEVTYEDAYILWYLLRYKIHYNRVGFPESSLFKVLEKLEQEHVGYSLPIDGVGYVKGTFENRYEEVLEEAKKEFLKKKKKKELLDRIKSASRDDLEKVLSYMDSVL